jgi:16S rRNA (guanine1207-N2)-methyltransferase
MSHYYTNDSNLSHDIKSFDIKLNHISFKFFTDSGVFSKNYIDFGTKLLIDSIEINESIKDVIDIGCGYGPIGLFVAKTNPKTYVYMYDINSRAIDLAIKNKNENKIENVEIKQGFLFEHASKKVDMIISNPPIRAGKVVVFKLYEEAHQLLNDHGVLYVVIQKKQGAPSSVEKLKTLFKSVDIINRDKGYWILLAKK